MTKKKEGGGLKFSRLYTTALALMAPRPLHTREAAPVILLLK
jgi:hypothetical protein